MGAISVGAAAPPIPGVELRGEPTAVFFYKVTCPVCQMAAPKADAFELAYPGRIVGVGQDPEPDLEAFSREYGMAIRSVCDPPPYATSDAYGIDAVPTLVLVGEDETVLDVVQSWDRAGYNRVSAMMAELLGTDPVLISEQSDGLPAFRPG